MAAVMLILAASLWMAALGMVADMLESERR